VHSSPTSSAICAWLLTQALASFSLHAALPNLQRNFTVERHKQHVIPYNTLLYCLFMSLCHCAVRVQGCELAVVEDLARLPGTSSPWGRC